ncbi:DUF4886 domain-containing protein [Phenylobacterium sp.]|jgi:hypothetical protein|uniref:DUF4886 domain-containing protein n=1 Tax=Phenylobacterium sp. TaxID=1871053 RepID=UPI002F934ECB
MRWSWIRSTAALSLSLTVLLGAVPAVAAESVLFIGNSFTFGAMSPVWKYKADTVTDLNKGGVGGVPALFKAFTRQAGLDYDVSLETVPGQGLDHHLAEKRALIDRSWDHVVMHGYSTLDRAKPGNPALLFATAGEAARMLKARNARANIHLTATWARPDLIYRPGQPWSGKSLAIMTADLRRAYDKAAAAAPEIKSVIPVGDAFQRAVDKGVADGNPYDGISPDQIDLWTYDHYHGSTFGYYLEALMVFGRITGKDPLSLGPRETSAAELGLSPAQATALQQIAHDELAAYRGKGR